MSDFTVQDEGTIVLLRATSPAGEAWATENLPDDATAWGDAVVVEHRYIGAIIEGIVGDGLEIS